MSIQPPSRVFIMSAHSDPIGDAIADFFVNFHHRRDSPPGQPTAQFGHIKTPPYRLEPGMRRRIQDVFHAEKHLLFVVPDIEFEVSSGYLSNGHTAVEIMTYHELSTFRGGWFRSIVLAVYRRNRRDDPLSRGPQRQVEGLNLGQPVTQQQGHSSAPRGKRSGQRGRGGYSGVGGRGSGSMNWNQSQHVPDTAYECSTTAWMTRVCAADGFVATKLTPSGLGGGFGNNWHTSTADKGLWIHSEKLKGLDKVAQRVVDDNPNAEGFQVIIAPVYPAKFAAIEERHTQKIVMNNNFVGHDGKPVGLFGRGIQGPSEEKPVAKGECDLCGSKTHLLKDCVMRAYKGHVSGCPLCNNCRHGVESCDKFKAMTLQEQVQVLVQDRKDRPPLNTSKPWWRYLHEFCTPEEFVPGVIAGFPWSPEFCRNKGPKGMKKIQEDYDANSEGYAFDVDEKTASFDKVYETYWQPNDMAWPAIFGPCIKSEGADERVVKVERND
ncbi:hypothetical protein FPANT_13200 [Fusarium pseudoanthophilum]|uniref:Uncharacterized protein n=1 Tax=Fusarium pseudoanthophilum TaxID=48495 RepID=A0A8H5KFD0_9HYPO|nr:hypothetical protein FPANT_13200 [Fusarium pseudoanthophilum]